MGAPCFVFAIGLTYGSSFARRARGGTAVAYRHFALRYLALIGIGAILSSGGTQVAGQPSDWGVLQAIGVAGLVCLPVIRLGAVWRFAIGGGLLLAYQLVLDAGALDVVRASVQGGLVGGLSWGALLILSTAVADVWRRGTAAVTVCCAILTLLAIAAVLVVPVSKTRESLSYMLVCLAIAAVAFVLTDLGARAVPARSGLLAWWGESALIMYLLHLGVLGLVTLPPVPWLYAGLPLWAAIAEVVLILAVLSVVAGWLHRRGVRVSL